MKLHKYLSNRDNINFDLADVEVHEEEWTRCAKRHIKMKLSFNWNKYIFNMKPKQRDRKKIQGWI